MKLNKRFLTMAAVGVGLLSTGAQAFARDRDDFNRDRRQDRHEDRRDIRERQDRYEDRRWDHSYARPDYGYYQAPAYNYYAPDYNYYQPPVYSYPAPVRRPGFSGSFYFGTGR